MIELSIVIPAYNEKKNISILYLRIKKAIAEFKDHEIIFVDDGSRDGTLEELKKIAAEDKKLKIIRFRKNFGQTAAMDAGFKYAKGKVIVSMDSDLQNDPDDIPRMITKLYEGYDVVCGWRRRRKDPFLKKITSKIARVIRNALVNDKIHDSGCTLKAFRKECFEDLDLFGEMHRFIPALLLWQGFQVTEIEVRHHPRKHGKTKYGMKRILKGFLDILVVKFWMQYSTRPIHLFGGIGIMMAGVGFLTGGYLAAIKILSNASIGNRPLLLLSVLLIILGTQFIVFGLVSDISIRNYYKNKPTYKIREIYNGNDKFS